MKNKKENIRLRTTDTVGKQSGHMDHNDRGAVSGHMDCYVLFSAGDSFFLSSLFPEKFSIEHYVELFRETDFGIWVLIP